MKSITSVNVNKIIQADPYNQKLIALISILEAHLNLVSNEHLDIVGKTEISEITLKDLGTLYSSVLCKNSGLNGVCWEYAVFNAIYYNDTYIQDLINLSINYLSGKNDFYRINAILWGGEKENLQLDTIKENIGDEDCIWTADGTYNFKLYIDAIYQAFRQKDVRSTLPKKIGDIWKTDLFVKKENQDVWYSVTVKWNKNDIKHYPGLSIGIHYEHINISKNETNPYLINKNFVGCSIPFAFNFGEYYSYMFRFFKYTLQEINFKRKNTLRLTFATSEEYLLFNNLYDLRKVSCLEIITYLKYMYTYINNTIVKNEIILSSYNEVKLPKIEIDTVENISGTILIPINA